MASKQASASARELSGEQNNNKSNNKPEEGKTYYIRRAPTLEPDKLPVLYLVVLCAP